MFDSRGIREETQDFLFLEAQQTIQKQIELATGLLGQTQTFTNLYCMIPG